MPGQGPNGAGPICGGGCNSFYATRFDDPLQAEPFVGAAKELFGALFLAGDNFAHGDSYRENIFPGQSETIRWREFDTRTFVVTYVPLMLFAWRIATRLAWKSRIWQIRSERPAAETFVSEGDFPVLILGLRSLLAVIPLTVFYLWFRSFLPVTWWIFRRRSLLAPGWPGGSCRVFFGRSIGGWLGFQLYFSQNKSGDSDSSDIAEVTKSSLRKRKIPNRDCPKLPAED